jgi:hypothetical protein
LSRQILPFFCPGRKKAGNLTFSGQTPGFCDIFVLFGFVGVQVLPLWANPPDYIHEKTDI